MILVKQGIWIIGFRHDNRSFQINQNLFYKLNLRSLRLDQSQIKTKVDFPLYKDI